MAIKLNALDTRTVLTALHVYREEELARIEPSTWKVEQIDPLLKQYRRSFKALERLGKL